MPTLKSRAKRAAVVVVAAASLFGLAGCRLGFEHSTLRQYTQAEGVNIDMANGHQVEQGRGYVKVRNLMILAQPDGSQARLAGTIFGSPSVSPAEAANTTAVIDTLQSVTGQAMNPDGATAEGSLTVSLPQPLPISVANPVQLQNSDIAVTGAKLTPGVDAQLTLTFQNNGRVTTRVPVVDATKPDFRTMTPVAAASGSASPSTSATPRTKG